MQKITEQKKFYQIRLKSKGRTFKIEITLENETDKNIQPVKKRKDEIRKINYVML